MKKVLNVFTVITLLNIICANMVFAQIISWNLSHVLNYSGSNPMPGYPGAEPPANSSAAVFMPGTAHANLLADATNTLNTLRRGAGLRNTSNATSPTAYANLTAAFVSTSTVSGGDYNLALSNNLYYEFSVSAKTNNYLHCEQLKVVVRRSGSAPASSQWAYRIVDNNDLTQINNATFNALNPFKKIGDVLTETDPTNGSLNTTPITISELKNVPAGKTVFFRLFIYGFSNNTTNTFAIRTINNNPAMELDGTVNDQIISATPSQDKYKVATYNLRYINSTDVGNLWADRKSYVVDLIQRYSFDVFGVQEAYASQLADVKSGLTNFDWLGRDRNNNGSSEYTAIFFNTSKFNVVTSGHFWLSPTPEIKSIGWDAMYERVCNWVQLQDKVSGYTFFVFNSHFDHQGTLARENSVALVQDKIAEIAGLNPTVFCGDLNFTQGDNNYVTLNSAGLLKDSYVLASKIENVMGTLNSFAVDEKIRTRIDHLFVTNNLKVHKYNVITDSYAGKMPSDHNPVAVEFSTKTVDLGELYWNFPEDFDAVTKDNYSTANLAFRTGNWRLVNTNVGASFNNDRASSGRQALRINDNNAEASAEMLFDVTEGVSKVTVEHSVYETHGPSKWALQYSTDQGNTWKQLGDVVYTSQKEKRLAVFDADLRGSVRFKIYRFPGAVPSKLSIDDLAIYKRKNTTSKTDKSRILLSWNLDNPASTGNEASITSTYNHSALQTSTLVRGSGLIPQNLSRGFASQVAQTTNSTLADTTVAMANDLYYQFAVQIKPGFKASLNTINAAVKTSTTGGASVWYWKYSLDGVNFYAPRSPFNFESPVSSSQPTLDLTQISSLQHLSATTVYFRLYQIGAVANSGFSGFSTADVAGDDNSAISITGAVESINTEQMLLGWYLEGATKTTGLETTVAATQVGTAVLPSTLGRHTSLDNYTSTLSGSFVSKASAATDGNLADTTQAINNNLYFGFGVEIKTGYKSSLNRIYYKVRTSGGGAKYWHWKYSLDDTEYHTLTTPAFGNTNGGDGKVMEDIDLSAFPQLQNLVAGDKVYFRLYFNGSNFDSGTSALGRSLLADADDYALALYGTSEPLIAAPLPVKMKNLEARAQGKANVIKWQTASEENNSHFELQRGHNTQVFETLGRVEPLKNIGDNSYRFNDAYPINGVNYYRLKQIDLDGKYHFSDVVFVRNSIEDEQISAYFTVTKSLKLEANVNASEASLTIFNVAGKKMHSDRLIASNGKVFTEINTDKWPSAVYLITLRSGQSVRIIKIIK